MSNEVHSDLRDIRFDVVFPSGLDTVLQQNQDFIGERRRVERIIKLDLLFAKHLMVSDTQLVDNIGVHSLFSDNSFMDFVKTRHSDGVIPLIANVRPGVNDFGEVVDKMLRAKMIFSHLPLEPQENQLYASECTRPALYCLAQHEGRNLEEHVRRLDIVYQATNRVTWTMPRKRYPNLVKHLFGKLWPQFPDKSLYAVSQLKEKLLDAIDNPPKDRPEDNPPTRSTFYRIIKSYQSRTSLKNDFRVLFVDFPYNLNFALSHRLQLVSHGEFRQRIYERLLPEPAIEYSKTRFWRVHPEIVEETRKLPLDYLSWEDLYSIRRETDFSANLDKLRTTSVDSQLSESARDIKLQEAMKEHVQFLIEKACQLLPAEKVYATSINPVTVGVAGVSAVAGVSLLVLTALHFIDPAELGWVLGSALPVVGGLPALFWGRRRVLTTEFKQFKNSLELLPKELAVISEDCEDDSQS